MTGKDVIKELMDMNGMSNTELAEMTGVTQATAWARLNNTSAKDMSLAVFAEMLNAMGYELVARRRTEAGVLIEMPVNVDAPSKPEGRGRPRKAPTPGPDGPDQP